MDKLYVVFFFLALLFLYFSGNSSGEEGEEFNYDPKSDHGPDHWGEIRPEWYKCKNGSFQSPIPLSLSVAHVAPDLGPLQFHYRPSNASFFNSGHDIRLEWSGGAGYLLINATKYMLQQCHWHSPSEHTLNGKRFDLEIHVVHKNEAGQIAVIGIFYEIGPLPDLFLQTVVGDLIHISKDKKAKVGMGVVDPGLVINIRRNLFYYRYMGSLTTPPCDENVVWTVLQQVKPVSRQQVGLLRLAVQDAFYTNARPLQQLKNGRLVQLQNPYIYDKFHS